jgi:hypothetical protein
VRFPGFIGPSYTLQSVNADAQRTVNLYPEMNESGGEKEGEVACLRATPGKRLLTTVGTGPIRGTYTASNGVLFVASGTGLYSVDANWSARFLGTILTTSTGPVSMIDNGIELVLVDGAYGYYLTLADNAYFRISSEGFLNGATQVAFQDGYFIFTNANSQQFFISDLNSVDFDAADIGSAEGVPDNLVGVISDQRNVYLFGERSTEAFYNSGNVDFPFERVQGAFLPIGCAAAHTIAKMAGSIFWLGQSDQGRGIVYRATGYQPQRISTHAIEKVIAGLSNISTARAWTYEQAGHSFYCLNLPGATTTWVFDCSTNLWHERAYLNSGILARDRAECHAFAYGTNVVGDYENGKIYALDSSTYSDNGQAIARIRTAPHISKEMRRVLHRQFQLDIEAGVGLDGSGQGIAPKVMLQWSNDGGHTWSSERWADIGAIGVTGARAIWRRLGASRDRIYRVTITDPVKVTLLGADLLLEECAS